MTRAKTRPLSGAQRVILEHEEGSAVQRDPGRRLLWLLERMPPDARTSTAAELREIAGADGELTAAETLVARATGGNDPRTGQFAAARAALTAFLEPLNGDAVAPTVPLIHRDDCAAPEVEAADHAAEAPPYGRCAVRVARCVGCGAQQVANRRLTIPADPDALERQRQREASGHGTANRVAIKPTSSKFA